MKNHKAIDQESNGINRRSFIATTIVAGAGLAVLAASQNEVSAQLRDSEVVRNSRRILCRTE
jgi:hypothetical protein